MGLLLPFSDAKKYIIPRDQILPRVEQIVKSTKQEVQVPSYVMAYLKKSIADRERCSSWFQEYYTGETSVKDSTDTHIHFTDMLRSILSLLKTVAPKTSKISQTQASTSGRPILSTGMLMHDRPRYSDPHVEDLDTEERLDSSDESSTVVSDGTPDIQAGLEEVYVAGSTETDRLLAMHELLRRLRLIRDYVRTIWSRYRAQQISLIHATIVTNLAIDCIHSLEDQYSTAFPESPVWAPTALLRTFLDAFDGVNEDWVKTWLPDVNNVYDSRLDVSKLSCHDKLIRNVILLDSMIPEQALHAKVGMLSSHDRITAGFKEMLDTREIRLRMVFSFSILCDIHLVLGDDLFHPFKDMRLQLERARNEDGGYVQNKDNGLMDGGRHKVNRDAIKINDMLVKEHVMMRTRSIAFKGVSNLRGARTRSKISKSKRVRNLRDMRPLLQLLEILQLLEKERSWQEGSSSPQLTEFMKVVQQYYTVRHDKTSLTKTQTRRDNVFLDPIVFLFTLSEWIEEKQPRLDFDYYRAHNICWRLLRRIEASLKIRKKFRKEYDLDVDFEVDQCHKYIPLFIFNRHIEDPNGKWMQSVGETIAKFFHEEPPKNLSPIPPPENLDDPLNIRYAKGHRMSEDVYHPEKDGKCCHVGVCELQVVYWRLQAGLSPCEEGDEDGAWWQGLRADLRDDETKHYGSHRKAPCSRSFSHSVFIEHPAADSHPPAASPLSSSPPLPPQITRPPTSRVVPGSPQTETPAATTAAAEALPRFNITAEEILAIMPPSGISLMEMVTHFSQRIGKDQMKEFSALLISISKYDPNIKRFTPLKLEVVTCDLG
ncbi:MAG: hypothetical protein Q9209_001730 [Squamulea sp. 1 TL-2023]